MRRSFPAPNYMQECMYPRRKRSSLENVAQAAMDIRPELGRSVDKDQVAPSIGGIARKCHARAECIHHLADHHRAPDLFVGETHAPAVALGLRGRQRVDATLRRLLHSSATTHIEIAPMNPGKRSTRRVFRRGAGPNCDPRLVQSQSLKADADVRDRRACRQNSALRHTKSVASQPRQVEALATTHSRARLVRLVPVEKRSHHRSNYVPDSMPVVSRRTVSMSGPRASPRMLKQP